MENLKNIVAEFYGKKILVFGDLMLDEHIWSQVQRISPEAPVPPKSPMSLAAPAMSQLISPRSAAHPF